VPLLYHQPRPGSDELEVTNRASGGPHDSCVNFATVERRKSERRRPTPSERMDVTRMEHENLCGQIDEVLRMLRRIEGELHRQSERIVALEGQYRRTAS
jgi:hypothetical protein